MKMFGPATNMTQLIRESSRRSKTRKCQDKARNISKRQFVTSSVCAGDDSFNTAVKKDEDILLTQEKRGKD